MRFKLDENIGRGPAELLELEGHDVATVREQGLAGATDEDVFRVAVAENRVLVTLDHDFGNLLRFRPEQSSGIVVLEMPRRIAPHTILERVKDLIAALREQEPGSALWVVEPGRIRIHEGIEGENDAE